MLEKLTADLAHRKSQALYRQRLVAEGPQEPYQIIDGQRLLTFCSNDYLGLANHPSLIKALQQGAEKFGCGSGAAHLINGHSTAHHQLEEALAELTGRSRALLFSTGYMANLGVMSALVGRSDQVFEDRLNHASLLDAAALAKAKLRRYQHLDVQDLTRLLASYHRPALIATDGVFSMDGDCAKLAELSTVALDHNSWLMVDDAHGFGVLGRDGAGSVAQAELNQDQVPILMATLGKAVGTFGAFVAGSDTLIESLIQKARPYIYTTALPPAIAYATTVSLQLIAGDEGQKRRQHLQQLIQQFRQASEQLDLPLMKSNTAIQPLLVGSSEKAVALSQILRNNGILVTAIRPPTVPKGTARLRITLSAAHQAADIDLLLNQLSQLWH